MDLITYVADKKAMYDEAVIISADEDHPLCKYFNIDEDLKMAFLVTKVPVQRNGDSSVSLVRGISRELIALTNSIQVIGEHDGGDSYTFDSDEARAKCESVYSTKPVQVDDGEGGTFMHHPPLMFGVFAR